MSGSRMMLVAEVALGKMFETINIDTELKSPPTGYNSVCSVPKSIIKESDFKVSLIYNKAHLDI